MDFKIGDKVYVKDDEYEIWDGEIVDVNYGEFAAFVAYETDYFFKHRWVSFEELLETKIDIET